MDQPTLHLPSSAPADASSSSSSSTTAAALPPTGAPRNSLEDPSSSTTVPGPSSRALPPAPLSAFVPWSPASPSGFPTPGLEPLHQHHQPALSPSSSSSHLPLSPSTRHSLGVSSHHSAAGSISSTHSFRTLNELPSPPPGTTSFGALRSANGVAGGVELLISPSTSFTTLPPPVTSLSLPPPAGGQGGEHQRSDSTLSTASSRTSSFFSQRFSVVPPPPPKDAPLAHAKSLSRAGSVNKAGPDSATSSRLGVGLPGIGGRRADHPRSASDASVGPRPMPAREGWTAKPYFAFERNTLGGEARDRAVSGPIERQLGMTGLPRTSSPPEYHAGLPPASLMSAPSEPAVAEPRAGDVLEEELGEDASPAASSSSSAASPSTNGSTGDASSKRKRRRWKLEGTVVGRGAFSSVWAARELADGDGKGDSAVRGEVVAVKMMSKEAVRENDRTFTSFEREVSILKRLSHPAIIPHLTSFTTPTHHCVVLPLIRGGELFSVIEEPSKWERIGRGWVKRVWRELEAGIAYLHSKGVVHRDIKLENILLTQPFPASNRPIRAADLPPLTTSFIQLTDFGLAKEVAPDEPPLTTRCGSDSYAAPEIIMGREYDGRRTDSWACGVVLFALLTRALPFGSPPVDDPSLESKASRRARMLRIAKGDYTWPSPPPSAAPSSESVPAQRASASSPPPPPPSPLPADRPVPGSARLVNAAARRLVDRLLTRDPGRRAVVGALGEDERWGQLEEEGDWLAE